jgi:hypothetical protein
VNTNIKVPLRFPLRCVRRLVRFEAQKVVHLFRQTEPLMNADLSRVTLVATILKAARWLLLCPVSLFLSSPAWAALVQQAYVKASNTEAYDEFGYSVAISGDTLVIGAWGEDSRAIGVNGDQNDNSAAGAAGAAYVFVRSGTNWTQQAYLKGCGTDGGAFFGFSVGISSNTVVIGAYQADGGAGGAYVFVRNGTNWSQQGCLRASNAQVGDEFGWSVAISGDTIVVGAKAEASDAIGVNGNQSNNNAPYSGAAYLFVRNGTTWSQQAYLKASNTGAYDEFAGSVAVSGNTVVVTAIGEGAAYVFVRNGTIWTQQAYLKGPVPTIGISEPLAISGDTIVINASGEAGAAHVFVRSGTNWDQQAYLKASNADWLDQFGKAVSISGDTIVIGAWGESSNATGVNGDATDNSAPESGAAYVFVRDGTNWSQQAYLKASNTGGSSEEFRTQADHFGWSVGISDDTVVVGAPQEASNATGINGNQLDNSARVAGAAYVFSGVAFGPRLALDRDGVGGYFIRFAGSSNITYRLQRAANVTGTWNDIATNTVPISGLIEYHDTSPPPSQAFYRAFRP